MNITLDLLKTDRILHLQAPLQSNTRQGNKRQPRDWSLSTTNLQIFFAIRQLLKTPQTTHCTSFSVAISLIFLLHIINNGIANLIQVRKCWYKAIQKYLVPLLKKATTKYCFLLHVNCEMGTYTSPHMCNTSQSSIS